MTLTSSQSQHTVNLLKIFRLVQQLNVFITTEESSKASSVLDRRVFIDWVVQPQNKLLCDCLLGVDAVGMTQSEDRSLALVSVLALEWLESVSLSRGFFFFNRQVGP